MFWRGRRAAPRVAELCTEHLRNKSRLPCARGAVTPKGFGGVTERILVRITVALRSAYPVPHNIPPRFRQRGDAYPFSFVTEKKSGKTVKEKFRPLLLA